MTCQYADISMIDIHCKIKIQNRDKFKDTYCQTGCPVKKLLNGDVE